MKAKAFPPKTCLIIGSATEDYPFVVVRTPALNYSVGATRRFFKFENGKGSTAKRTRIKNETASTNMSRPEDRFTL
jgi:hypothetical protein